MTTQSARPMEAMLVGVLAGIVAGLVFATAHALIIVPIWNRMLGGLAFGAAAGAVGGWAYSELYPDKPDLTSAAHSGATYGAVLWLLVTPVTAADAVLRAVGILPRYELVGVVIAVALAVAAGSLWGWHRHAANSAWSPAARRRCCSPWRWAVRSPSVGACGLWVTLSLSFRRQSSAAPSSLP